MSLFTPNGQLLPLAPFRDALAAGADPNEPHGSKVPLLEAAKHHVHHLRQLLANPRTRLDVLDPSGATALVIALNYGHAQAVQLLIDAGVSVQQADLHGGSPLHYAVKNEGVGPLRALLAAGADPDTRGAYGRTPLAELLMELHGDPTPIEHKARVLLSGGANPNLVDDNARSALHAAALSGYGNVVEALLEFGANPDLRCTNGLRPIDEVRARLDLLPRPMGVCLLRVGQLLVRHHDRERLMALVASVVQRCGPIRVEERHL
jgi:ankyrin repeat protein